MAVEIEAKIYIGQLDLFEDRLVAANAETITPRYHERNQLFSSPYQDFKEQRIVLRLRRDAEEKITLKTPSDETTRGTQTRHEFETTVGDIRTMDEILRHLGYRHSLFYEKYRTIYRLPDVPNAEIMVDEMPFGNFVEIEGTPSAIEAAVQRLDMEDAHRIMTNYAGILKAVQEEQGLTFEQATFNNFRLVKVDPAIFDEL